MIKSDEAQLLAAAGFRYYSFISYPRTDQSLCRFAKQFHCGLESILSQNLPSCQHGGGGKYAFLDSDSIAPGSLWEHELGAALCRSISMVALCVPNYAQPPHSWCGKEWAGMEELGQKRLPNGPNSIFVVRLGELSLPDQIARVQLCDLSERRLQGLHRTVAFDGCLRAALRHAVKVARAWLDFHPDPALGASGLGSDCQDYRLPEFSAFGPTRTPLMANRQTSGTGGNPEESK
jgi:hypothetical protein